MVYDILSLIKVSFSMSILILFVILVNPLIRKKYSFKLKYYIWLLIALRLIIPFSFTMEKPIIDIEIPAYSLNLNEYGTKSLENENDILNNSTKPQLNLISIIYIIWVIGALIFLTNKIVEYWIQRKYIFRWGHTFISENTRKLFNDMCKEMNIKSKVHLMISEQAKSPMILGFCKSYLILPHEYSKNDLKYIFKHELTHYKRKDLWYKFVLLLSNSIHWFNPIMHFMVSFANEDLELSCDDKVISNISANEKEIYSKVILNEISYTNIKNSILTTCFKSSKKTMLLRFENIFSGKKKKGLLLFFIIVILTIVTNRGIVFSREVLDYRIIGATILESQEWYKRGDKIAAGTKSAEIVNEVSENVIFVEDENSSINTITEVELIPTAKGCYEMQDIITNSNDMAIFSYNSEGLTLKKGDIIDISFSLDIDTVTTSGANGGVVEIGFKFGEDYKILQEEKNIDFNLQYEVQEGGEYLFYTVNRVAGYQIIKNGKISIK